MKGGDDAGFDQHSSTVGVGHNFGGSLGHGEERDGRQTHRVASFYLT